MPHCWGSASTAGKIRRRSWAALRLLDNGPDKSMQPSSRLGSTKAAGRTCKGADWCGVRVGGQRCKRCGVVAKATRPMNGSWGGGALLNTSDRKWRQTDEARGSARGSGEKTEAKTAGGPDRGGRGAEQGGGAVGAVAGWRGGEDISES